MGEIAVGDLLAERYEIHAIKRGGMGLVLLGYDREFKEPVALKTFQDRFLADERSRQRFRREAEAWVQLDRHPNIVYAHYFSFIADKPYLALEMVAEGPRGNGLRRRIKGGPLELEEVLRIGIQICRGLAHAGKKVEGLVHRDLKPENLLITPDEVLKVTDFGLVRSLEAESSPLLTPPEGSDDLSTVELRLTRHGVLLGTPQYMAPEQFAVFAQLDVRADIYACGVVLFEMLVGRPPFGGRSTKDLAQAHLNLAPPRLSTLRSALPAYLETVVLACLEKDPHGRPANFGELERELAAVAVRAGISPPPAADATPLQTWEQNNKGSSLVALGRPREGLRCFDQALEQLSSYAPAHNNRGVALRELGARHDAVAAFLRALELKPDYADAWYNLGVTLGELGSSVRERYCYTRALELEPRHVEAWHNGGVSHLERYARLAQRPNLRQALEAFERAIALRPDHPQAHYHRGLARWASGDRDGALSDLQQAAAAQPAWEPAGQALALYRAAGAAESAPAEGWGASPLPLPPPPPCGELIERSAGFEAIGLPDEALALYDEALELYPAALNLQRLRAQMLLQLGRAEPAIEAYEAAVIEDAEDAAAIVGWGRALLLLGRVGEARDRFFAAVRLRPSDAEAWTQLAAAEMALGRPQQALRALIPAEFARRRDPDYWHQRGRAALALRRPRLAREYFETELRLDRSRAAAHCGLAEALVQLRESRLAKHALLQAIQADPTHSGAWCLLARIFLEEDRSGEALICLRYIKARSGHDPEIDRLSARAFLAQKRLRRAAAAFQELLKRLPQDSEAQLGLMRCLQELEQQRQGAEAGLRR
jgi:serine/threonine protein kinase/cytochrome c-type biogenesis protein CcmH/NrfG